MINEYTTRLGSYIFLGSTGYHLPLNPLLNNAKNNKQIYNFAGYTQNILTRVEYISSINVIVQSLRLMVISLRIYYTY